MNRPVFCTSIFALMLGTAACLTSEAPRDEATEEAKTSLLETDAVSETMLVIEELERTLDRGGDAANAKRQILTLLTRPDISVDERTSAILVLSRAHEALGEDENAISVLEQEMARHGDDPSWSSKDFRTRLRELLTGSPQSTGLEPRQQVEAPPFARLLTQYFPENDDGKVNSKWFMIGGDASVSDELGTFDLGSALRAEHEEACPMCPYETSVQTSRSRSDWLMIPVAEKQFDDAMLVFYFDLGKNRIPGRYERHLPMPVADIERELEAGRSFAIAKERVGAPPVVLVAAPRTAMLEDVEKHLAQLDALPTTIDHVEVSTRLRNTEIQGVVRDDYFADARGCYETQLERDPDAEGRIKLRFVIGEEGGVTGVEVSAEGTLDQPDFVACIETTLAKLRFPAGGTVTTVTYPIVLSR